MNQPITTAQFERLRDSFLDGTLSAQDQVAFNQYLHDNPQAAQQLQQEQQYLSALTTDHTLHLRQSEDAFINNVLDAWETESTPATFSIQQWLRPALLAAAALAITALTWVLAPDTSTQTNTNQPTITAAAPGTAINPLSVLLRETHQQYNSKSKQVSETFAQPAALFSFSSILNAITPAQPSTTNTPAKKQG